MKTTLRKCRKDLRLTNSVFETDQLTEFMNLAPEILASIHRRHCAVHLDVGKLHESSTEIYRI